MPKSPTAARLVMIGSLLAIGAMPAFGQPGPTPTAGAPRPDPVPVATPPPTAPPTRAEKAVDEAIEKLAKIESVTAKLRIKADALGQVFQIDGEYAKAPGNRIKLRMDLTGLPETSATMQQICDGTTLWDYQRVLETERFTKVEIDKILPKLDDPGFDAEAKEQFRDQQLGFAGPDALLRGLRKVIGFDSLEESTLDGRPVLIARGTWKDRSVLNSPDQPPLPAVGPLPAYVPSVAAVWLDAETGWPHQIKLDGQLPSVLSLPDTRKKGPDGQPIGARSTAMQVQASHLLITYSDVQVGAAIKPEEFAFEPPRRAVEQGFVSDLTPQYVAALEGYLAAQAAQRPTEGADAGATGTTTKADLSDGPAPAANPSNPGPNP